MSDKPSDYGSGFSTSSSGNVIGILDRLIRGYTGISQGCRKPMDKSVATRLNAPVVEATVHSDEPLVETAPAEDVATSSFSYHGWEQDVEEAEWIRTSNPSLFDHRLRAIILKQTLHSGDRSHPQLVALDALVAWGLSYYGWEQDVKRAEANHIDHPSLFEAGLHLIRHKQIQHAAAIGIRVKRRDVTGTIGCGRHDRYSSGVSYGRQRHQTI